MRRTDVTGVEAGELEEPYVREPLDFDTFYEREYRPVFALAFALLGSAPAAEDITQDAFAALYRRWKSGMELVNPSGNVRTSVANRCRSAFRRRLVETRALLVIGHRRPEVEPLPEDSHRFWEAVRALPPRQAQVATLFYLEDRPVREVAAILGIADGTVKVHLQRARRTLAERLGVVDDDRDIDDRDDEGEVGDDDCDNDEVARSDEG